MKRYHPFIDDPQALAQYAGHRYVVLRVIGDPALRYREVQERLRAKLGNLPVTFPAVPHVTLAGYKQVTDEARLTRMVATWAATIEPLELEVGEPVSWFPPPFQVIFLPVRRTQALFDALETIRDAGARAGFSLATVTPPDQWTFHLTLANCAGLGNSAWTQARRIAGDCAVRCTARSIVKAAELAVFDNRAETSGGSFPLGCPVAVR
jgi:2'-5' RNA ligase